MSKRDIRLLLIAGCAVVLFAGFIFWRVRTAPIDVEISAADFCPVDRSLIPEYAMVLLDLSEPVEGGNAIELERRMVNVGTSLDLYGKLIIYDIHDRSEPIVSMCRPQTIEECDPFTAPRACRGVQEEFERSFETPVTEAIAGFLSRQSERDSSPIIEAINDVSTLSEFSEAPAGDKELYVLSDMLQHTPGVYSHHRAVSSNEIDVLSNSTFYGLQKPDLTGVSVSVLYLLRPRYLHLQSDSHKDFWRQFFTRNGAEVDISDYKFSSGSASASSQPFSPVRGGVAEKEEVIPEPPVPDPEYGAFTVVVEPSSAVVRLLNHSESYESGMRLPPGEYDIEVIAAGFESQQRMVSHGTSSTTFGVELEPVPVLVSEPSEAPREMPKKEDPYQRLTTVLGRSPAGEATDQNGWTDLHYAAFLDMGDLVDDLVDGGGNPNKQTIADEEQISDSVVEALNSLSGRRLSKTQRLARAPLHYAAESDAESAAMRLIARGADINLRDSRRESPLHIATRYGSTGVLALLLKEGAEVDAKNEDDATPLHIAAFYDSSLAVEMLVEAGASTEARANARQTPLHYAAWRNATEALNTLILAGASLGSRADDRLTPLHYAVDNSSLEAAQALVCAGAPVNVRTSITSGRQTLLEFAEEKQASPVLIDFLQDADVCAR